MKFTQEHLKKICLINNYQLPSNIELVFFGIRGAVPVSGDNKFYQTQEVELSVIDNKKLNCTIGQWNLKTGLIALFHGSTVPYISNIASAKLKNGLGTNQLMEGFYNDYQKGMHKPGTPTGHDAFYQNGVRPVRRTVDDLDYDNDDRVDISNPYDNLHAAWTTGEGFASAGCQVISGYPKCQKIATESGDWKNFRQNAYNISQQKFPYILFSGIELNRVINSIDKKQMQKLRFGSVGLNVKILQEKLKDKKYYNGNIDGVLGKTTFEAVLKFQTDQFGNQDDGIVGNLTAQKLGFKLSEV